MNKIKIPKNWEFKHFEVEGNTTKFVYEDQLGIEHIYIDEKPEPELPTYEELQDRINSAINYIEENSSDYYTNEPHYRGFVLLNIEELLDILEGDNK